LETTADVADIARAVVKVRAQRQRWDV